MILSTFEIFCILNHFNYTSIILSNILRTIVCTSDIGRTLTEEKKTPHYYRRTDEAVNKQLIQYFASSNRK